MATKRKQRQHQQPEIDAVVIPTNVAMTAAAPPSEQNKSEAVRELTQLLPMSDVHVTRSNESRSDNDSDSDESVSSIDEAPVAGVRTACFIFILQKKNIPKFKNNSKSKS